jgi:hypothetical protein
MPTVKHLGISRRIESDRERRRLRDIFVKRIRARDVGFIIRTVAEGSMPLRGEGGNALSLVLSLMQLLICSPGVYPAMAKISRRRWRVAKPAGAVG